MSVVRQHPTSDWLLKSAARDQQSVTSDWESVAQPLIEGVLVKSVKNVPRDIGFLSEIFRVDWGLGVPAVDQIFQSTLHPRAISAWHAHAETTDRLFVVHGMVKVVLYDARSGSSTFGRINELHIGVLRPALVVVPPRVWHGIQNVSDEPAVLLNIVDRAYVYEEPDHWRVPPDSPEVPFRFET